MSVFDLFDQEAVKRMREHEAFLSRVAMTRSLLEELFDMVDGPTGVPFLAPKNLDSITKSRNEITGKRQLADLEIALSTELQKKDWATRAVSDNASYLVPTFSWVIATGDEAKALRDANKRGKTAPSRLSSHRYVKALADLPPVLRQLIFNSADAPADQRVDYIPPAAWLAEALGWLHAAGPRSVARTRAFFTKFSPPNPTAGLAAAVGLPTAAAFSPL